MVPPDLKEMEDAWRALFQPVTDGVSGWKTIRVAAGSAFHVRAGRRLPGNEEALLVGFNGMRLPKAEHLPMGRGFSVTEEDLGPEGGGRIWVALCRQPAGSRELFGVMADDLAGLLRISTSDNEQSVFQSFVARIRAWQEFMQRGSDGVLSPESEVGLVGELQVLITLISAGVSHYLAVDSWKGPIGGVQDFSVGAGAIEVKSTIAAASFPAKIGSLDQLDDAIVHPLYLAAVRLAIDPDGKSLPDIVREVRELLDVEPVARREFDSRLLHAGYFDTASLRYSRRFRHTATRILPVSDGFPRLIRIEVPVGITRALYEIDLDLLPLIEADLIDALKSLGGIAS